MIKINNATHKKKTKKNRQTTQNAHLLKINYLRDLREVVLSFLRAGDSDAGGDERT